MVVDAYHDGARFVEHMHDKHERDKKCHVFLSILEDLGSMTYPKEFYKVLKGPRSSAYSIDKSGALKPLSTFDYHCKVMVFADKLQQCWVATLVSDRWISLVPYYNKNLYAQHNHLVGPSKYGCSPDKVVDLLLSSAVAIYPYARSTISFRDLYLGDKDELHLCSAKTIFPKDTRCSSYFNRMCPFIVDEKLWNAKHRPAMELQVSSIATHILLAEGVLEEWDLKRCLYDENKTIAKAVSLLKKVDGAQFLKELQEYIRIPHNKGISLCRYCIARGYTYKKALALQTIVFSCMIDEAIYRVILKKMENGAREDTMHCMLELNLCRKYPERFGLNTLLQIARTHYSNTPIAQMPPSMLSNLLV